MDFSKMRNYLFLGALGIITIAFIYILKGFAYPIFWAAVIAGIFYPLYLKILNWSKSPNLSATLSLILIFLIIFLPLALIGSLLLKESVSLYGMVDNNKSELNQSVQNTLAWLTHNGVMDKLNIDQSFLINRISDTTKSTVAFIFDNLTSFTQNTLSFLLLVFIMFFSLFFFLRDGAKFLKKAMHLSPIGDKYEKKLYEKFTSTARATLKGTLIVGGIQGLLGGLLFAVVGIKGALIWGLIMAACTMVGITSGVVWFPAGVVMLILGHGWQGVLIFAFGFLVISTIDNFLRPVLVGRDTRMHPLLALLSSLGGLFVFGISGLVIGPIIASLLLAFWEMYEEYYHDELNKN